MLIADVKAIVRRYVDEVWNGADLAALEELTTASFAYRLGGQPPRDRVATGQFIRSTHEAFPDWRVEIVELIAEGERAAVVWRGEVTHQGPFKGIAPTGRRIAVSGINVYRIDGGRIAQEWEQMDSLSMLQGMGVLPPG